MTDAPSHEISTNEFFIMTQNNFKSDLHGVRTTRVIGNGAHVFVKFFVAQVALECADSSRH